MQAIRCHQVSGWNISLFTSCLLKGRRGERQRGRERVRDALKVCGREGESRSNEKNRMQRTGEGKQKENKLVKEGKGREGKKTTTKKMKNRRQKGEGQERGVRNAWRD